MTTSDETEPGTSNSERIRQETSAAADDLPDRSEEYKQALAKSAMKLFTVTAEHDERQTNINQRYEQTILELSHVLNDDMEDRAK